MIAHSFVLSENSPSCQTLFAGDGKINAFWTAIPPVPQNARFCPVLETVEVFPPT